MASICIYFQVHQPHRLRWFWPGDQLHGFDRYFDNSANKEIFNKVANKCYWPTNNIILELIDRYKDFKVSFSIPGTLLNQCEKWNPDLLETFKQMANSGQIEFLDETYYHSLASLFEDKTEFKEQILQHRDSMRSLFGYTPKVFRNTELLYNNSIAKIAEELGYKAILTEGIERVLEWRSPNFVYKAKNSNIRVLMRNYRLSDDIGYRFSARWWEEYPLTTEKWATWACGVEGEILNIFMDYETFGEHQWPNTGIFHFLRAFPDKVLERHLSFITPSEAVQRYNPVAEIDVGDFST